jgi:glycerophosphoryl diester phosphodiesterase
MKSFVQLLTISVVLLMNGCRTTKQASVPATFPAFYKEGHRGGTGLMPENTIPAMKKGLEVGANVLELDVYTTKDGQVLVAHDPYVNINHSRLADGTEISKEEAPRYTWHQMNYADIKKIDVGSKYYKVFPQQEKVVAYMPLLGELIDSVEAFSKERRLPAPIYNIELKTSVAYDTNRYNSPPAELVEAVMQVVNSKNIGNRFYIQSFDMRPLQYIHQKYPKVVIGFLTGSKISFEDNIKQLGFLPHIYSPHHSLVNKELVDTCKANKIRIIPWTVDDKDKMQSLVSLGVDGIITDYPNYFAELGIQ